MFNLPAPKLKLPKPGIGIPEINFIKYPREGAVFNKYELSGNGCTLIITPKKYSPFGRIISQGAPWIISNPLCRKPPKNPDPESSEIREQLPQYDGYVYWIQHKIIHTYQNWNGNDFAEYKVEITPLQQEYRDYPGNALDGGNYPIGYYQNASGIRLDSVYASYDGFEFYNQRTGEYDVRNQGEPLYKNENNEPLAGLYTLFGMRYFRCDEYGNPITNAPENKPYLINTDYGYFKRFLKPEEIVIQFVEEYPATQKGLALTCQIVIKTRVTLNDRGGRHPFTNQDFTGKTYTTLINKLYTWHIYKRPNHAIRAYNFQVDNSAQIEATSGNTFLPIESYGIGFGGEMLSGYGWNTYGLHIPASWFESVESASRGNRFFWVNAYGNQYQDLDVYPPPIYNDVVQRGIDVGFVFLHQPNFDAQEYNYIALRGYPIYKSYREQKQQFTYDNAGYGIDYGTGFLSQQTWYYLDGEPPNMKDDCCQDIKKLLKLVLKRQGELPANVPDLFTKQNPQTIKIESLAELMLWQTKQLDALIGAFPIDLEIKDSDLTKEGDQKQKITLPNIAETLAEVLGVLLVMKAESQYNIEISAKAMLEAGQSKKAATIAAEIALANAEFLGYKLEQKKRTIKMLFSIDKQKTDEVLKESEIDYIGYENTDKNDLNDYLRRVLEMAAMYKAANFVRIGSRDDLLKKLQVNVDELADQYKKDNKEDFDTFTERAEKGFTDITGISDIENPWGKPFNERPRIREIGENSGVD